MWRTCLYSISHRIFYLKHLQLLWPRGSPTASPGPVKVAQHLHTLYFGNHGWGCDVDLKCKTWTRIRLKSRKWGPMHVSICWEIWSCFLWKNTSRIYRFLACVCLCVCTKDYDCIKTQTPSPHHIRLLKWQFTVQLCGKIFIRLRVKEGLDEGKLCRLCNRIRNKCLIKWSIILAIPGNEQFILGK